jgi:1-phosphofructokinase family hexose kinase
VIVSVALSASLDRALVVDELVPGAIHRPHTVVEVAGGKGFNVARAAHRLGAPVFAAGILGGHTGARIADLLRADGVPFGAVRSERATRTCTSVACSGTGALTEFYEPASPVGTNEWERLGQEVRGALTGRQGWLTLSGSLPPGAPADGVATLVELAREHGFRVAVDTHGAALRTALATRPDLLKVNAGEAAELLGRDGSARELVRALHEATGAAGTTVVTAGADGAWAAHGDTLLRVLPLRRGAFPVGSGDCFLAGLGTALDRDGDPADALRLAAGAATANALEPGAAVFDRSTALRLREDAVVEVA